MNTALLEQQAIKSALLGDWDKAIEQNKIILSGDPQNIAALNRLAKAFLESGHQDKAVEIYKKVLLFDKYNPIASKSIERLESREKDSNKEKPKKTASATTTCLFLEEPGKTKIVRLHRLTSPQQLAGIDCGDSVCLVPQKRFIIVKKGNGTYIGRLPEDVSYRLTSLMKGGNRYSAIILGVNRQNLEIFIRETFRSQKFRNFPSF